MKQEINFYVTLKEQELLKNETNEVSYMLT